MIRHFCDVCAQGVDPTKSGFRTFENLHLTVGFNLTPTVKGATGTNNHICNKCLGELMVLVIKRISPDSIPVSSKPAIAELTAKYDAAEVRRGAAEFALREATQLLKQEENKKQEAIDALEALKIKILVSARDKENEKKVLDAQAAQLEIDKRDNPEYIKRVARRDRERVSK